MVSLILRISPERIIAREPQETTQREAASHPALGAFPSGFFPYNSAPILVETNDELACPVRKRRRCRRRLLRSRTRDLTLLAAVQQKYTFSKVSFRGRCLRRNHLGMQARQERH